MSRIPVKPSHPERVCWGCDKYCPADDLTCGNGSVRTPHPIELFGEDWAEWAQENAKESSPPARDDAERALVNQRAKTRQRRSPL